uniref:RING-type domain-containing protein n=1 Tax=Rhizophora mucronata TaxID=61149 RepID=A0A2P2LAF2_RHIMU
MILQQFLSLHCFRISCIGLEMCQCEIMLVGDGFQFISHSHGYSICTAERLDQDMGGILTTICNHSFHISCISKWTDSSCPVSN